MIDTREEYPEKIPSGEGCPKGGVANTAKKDGHKARPYNIVEILLSDI